MREPENIQQVTELGIDLMGFIFWPKSPRYVKSVTVKAGIVPNLPNSKVTRNAKKVKRVGVFVDEMPQTVITHAYNYRLDYIQLHGNESPIYIENLKRTLIPDILPDPFLLSGGIGPEDADRLKQFNHPMCIGIDLNSRFEDEPGVKNVEKLKRFIECIMHNA